MLLVMLVRGLVVSELEVAVRKVESAIRPIMEI